MKKIVVTTALALLASFPAYGAENPIVAAEKEAMLRDMREETVDLGGNRYLIFSGSPGPNQYIYSVDIITTKKGVPHIEPIFMEDYDLDTGSVALSEGAAFPEMSYHFDKKNNLLEYTSKDPQTSTHYQYKYLLSGDSFLLQEVLAQDAPSPCAKEPCPASPVKTLFKVQDNAKTH